MPKNKYPGKIILYDKIIKKNGITPFETTVGYLRGSVFHIDPDNSSTVYRQLV